jgi:Concanavalin A-like lectin/glucanases superfamily
VALKVRIAAPSKRSGFGLLAAGLVASVALVGSVSAVPPRPSQVIVIVPGCVVDPTDVLGWWRGNGDLAAAIGPGLDGSAAFATGIIGQGLAMDGTEVLSTGVLPVVSTGVTVETWLKPTVTGSTQTIMSRWDFPSTDDSARSYALFLDPSGSLTWSTDETSTRRPQEFSAAAPQLLDGRFHHVAATWDRSNTAIYVDGQLLMSGPSQGGTLNPATTTSFRLGSKAGAGNPFPFVGVLDEPTVIRRALSATEVQGIVDAGPKAKCLPDPVVVAGASGATTGAAARWKGANTGAEVFVGPLLPPSALPRSEANHTWTPGQSFDVSMAYSSTDNALTAAAGATAPVFGAIDVGGTPGSQMWHVTGADLAGDFTLTGRIEIDGAGFVGNEAMRVQATLGCAVV